MFYHYDQQELYSYMKQNQQPQNNQTLLNLSHSTLTLKQLIDKTFDIHFLDLILNSEGDIKQQQIDKFMSILEFFQKQYDDDSNNKQQSSVIQLLSERSNGQIFLRNLTKIVQTLSNKILLSNKISPNTSESSPSLNQIQFETAQSKYNQSQVESQSPKYSQLQELFNWFIVKFIEQSQESEIRQTKNNFYQTVLEQIPECITIGLNAKLFDKSIFFIILQTQQIIKDEQYFSEWDKRANDLIYNQLKRRQALLKIMLATLPKNLSQQQQDKVQQLQQFGFFYFQKSLQYFQLTLAPMALEFMIKLLKIQRDESGWQVDLFSKNKMIKYLKEMFDVVVTNFNKASLNQIVDFCTSIQQLKLIGFDLHYQLSFFQTMMDIIYQFQRVLMKVKKQLIQLKRMKEDNSLYGELFQIEQKLMYLIKSITTLLVHSFYHDDVYNKSNNERRMHQIVVLWNYYFENKQDPFMNQDLIDDNKFNKLLSQLKLGQDNVHNKYEEQLVKKIAFLKIANRFLIRDKDLNISFSSNVIIDLVFPKLDLTALITGILHIQQKCESQTITITQYLLKHLYKFYFNLMANTKDQSLRDRALKELSKSISQVFTTEDSHIQNEIKSNVLDYVALKIQSNYYKCDINEQIQFLIEMLIVLNQQLFKIEDEFLFSLESCKGSVEGMRQLSLFRQLVQKAQGQKYQNMSIGSIVEKKVIDLKKIFQLIPLVSKCCQVLKDHRYQHNEKIGSLLQEFWVYIVINNPYFSKKNKNQNQFTNDEAKDLNQYIQQMRELYEQASPFLNIIALISPNIIQRYKVSLLDFKIVMLLTENRTAYACQNFYYYLQYRQLKVLFKGKKKQYHNKLELQEMLFLIILNEMLQRCLEEISNNITYLNDQSFLNKFMGFLQGLGNDDEEEKKDIATIHVTHQNLKEQISDTIKYNTLLKESMVRTAIQYIQLLITQKGTLTKEIIGRDFIYLIQHCCSIDRTLSEYSQNLCVDYIRNFPFVCFSPDIIKTFTELLTTLHQKIGREFDSKSKPLQNEKFKYQVLLHTDQKILVLHIIFIMNCLMKLIFRGLYIDHNFVKVLCLHLIKQETALLSYLPFGFKFLKFLINSFKVDKEAIETFKDQADKYNPYFWLVKETEFDNKISSSDLSHFVVDKGLIRLQKININSKIPYSVAQDILKQIDYSIKNESEFDFQGDDRFGQNNSVEPIIKAIIECCQQLNVAQYLSVNKTQNNLKLLNKLSDLNVNIPESLRKLARDHSLYKQIKLQIVRQMLSYVTSLKSIMLNKGSPIRSMILTQLLDISKYFLQPQLLKFILMRLIPFLHSISPHYFDSTFFFLIGEMLHYTIYQINNLGNLKYDKKISSQDIFTIKTNYFNSLQEFEIEEFNQEFMKYFNQNTINLVNLSQIGYYEIRWKCLCKLHELLIRFLNDNMQIHLVKNVKLSVIANILKLNFLVDKKLVEFIPLDNVCQVLKGSIEIIQLMKEFKEKFKNSQNIEVREGKQSALHPYTIIQNLEVKFDIESFYYKTLKFGLSHFAKNVNLYNEPLFTQCSNQALLIRRHQLYKMVCKYLSKDKLHELNEETKITKLKRVKKRFNSVIFKSHRKELLIIDQQSQGERASVVIDSWGSSQLARKLQADIGYGQQQVYSIIFHQGADDPSDELNVRPYYLRKALFYLLCNELDKIKAFAQKLNEQLHTEYSILSQNKLNHNFLQQIISEIPDKNLNLAYYIIIQLYPLLQTEDLLQDVLKQYLGAKITLKQLQYLDCPHFFDIFINYNIENLKSILTTLIYWKPPHIQLLLTDKYENFPDIQLCFSKIMKRLHSEQIIFYLSQILQSLASRSGSLIKTFLIEYSQQSVLFAHQLIWLAKVESKIDQDHKRPPSPKQMPPGYNILNSEEYQQFVQDQIKKGIVGQKQLLISKITPFIIAKVIRNMDSEQTAFFKKVDNFFERMTAISGKLKPQYPKPQKRDIIANELKKIEVNQDIYMPTNPRYQITAIKLDSGAPMQSAAKCPILVSFFCRKFEGPDKYFEKKLKMKKDLMDKMERQVKAQQTQIQFDIDPLPDDEEKGPLFINELIRPIQRQRQSSSSIHQQQSQVIQQQPSIMSSHQEIVLQRRLSAEDRLHEIEKRKNMVKQQTTLSLNQSNSSPIELKSCIFKVFDDIRQDNLALQIISMFKGVFEKCGLDLFVFPYKTISNRTGDQLNVGGIIEVIPNSISRDQMGKTNRCNLYEYFINKFGQEESPSFQVARENFIKSQAAYSIISYILQIKDRHNGNILISDKGHLIHIDFGFIFDISPGGNLKFESANFKLTQEMIHIMGGSQDSEAFIYYKDLTVRAFLAIRNYYEHMYCIVKLMVGSGLGCFMKDSLKHFTDRFQLKKNDLAAAKYMQDIINDAYNKLTTKLYDDIQYYQNGISR